MEEVRNEVQNETLENGKENESKSERFIRLADVLCFGTGACGSKKRVYENDEGREEVFFPIKGKEANEFSKEIVSIGERNIEMML